MFSLFALAPYTFKKNVPNVSSVNNQNENDHFTWNYAKKCSHYIMKKC